MKFPVKDGDVLQGAYRVERVIGMGGMAVVVAAIDLKNNERVAVKVLLKKAARSEEVVKRFQREQRTIGMLRSEHVTRMLGAGIHGSSPYMVMEFLDGRDLSEVLKERGPLQVSEAVDYVMQAMEAIAEAHSIGVIHRDLKPGNLFLSKGLDGTPFIKVLDFGISKATDPHNMNGESSLTQTSAVMGSPFYMSPEQMLSARNVSAGSDIWALGVIIHQLVTGALPFAASTPEKVCSRVLNGSPTLLRDVNPNLPVALEEVVHRCLQRRPQNRFANVADLALRLVEFAPERARRSLSFITECVDPTEATPEKIVVSVPAAIDVPDSPTVIYVASDSKFSPKRAALTGIFGLAMFGLGLGVGLFTSGPSKPTAAAGPPALSASASAEASAKPPDEAPDLPQPDLEHAPTELDLDQDDPRSGRPKHEKSTKREKNPTGDSPTEPESAADSGAPSAPSAASAAPPESSRGNSDDASAAPKPEEPRRERPKKPKPPPVDPENAPAPATDPTPATPAPTPVPE